MNAKEIILTCQDIAWWQMCAARYANKAMEETSLYWKRIFAEKGMECCKEVQRLKESLPDQDIVTPR